MTELDVKEIDCLSKWEYNIDGDDFVKQFKEAGGDDRMGNHMWDKFNREEHHSILGLFGAADDENRGVIVKMLSKACRSK